MNKWIILLVILLSGCDQPAIKNTPIPQGATVLVLGDSLSFGTGANEGEDYPTLLAKNTGWQMINAGVPGDTSAGGLQRLPDLLAEHQPKLLIVELGGNDLLRQVPKSQTISNLKAILAQAKAQNIPSVLVAIPEISALRAAIGQLSDHPLYEEIAKETGTVLIADVFSEVLSDNDLKSDQIHANAKGYAEVSRKISEQLKQLGFIGHQ
jgi:acyl-CoA thioesterase I